jgi:thioredoxin 1
LTAQVETLAKETYNGRVNFYMVNAAADRALLDTLDIRGVPSFLFYKGGSLYATLAGKQIKKEHVREKTDEMLTA